MKLEDEPLYGHKMLDIIKRLGLELPDIKNWNIILESNKLKHITFQTHQFPTVELATCFVYQRYNKVKSAGGYLSSEDYFYFEGKHFSVDKQKYSSK